MDDCVNISFSCVFVINISCMFDSVRGPHGQRMF